MKRDPNNTDKDDWRWQLAHRIRDPAALGIDPWQATEGSERGRPLFPMSITPYYAALMQPGDPHDPLRIMSVPDIREGRVSKHLRFDPIDEMRHSPLPGLIRRYPDRALLLVAASCPVNCRHCTRRSMGKGHVKALTEDGFEKALDYIAKRPEIKDVILSGGDPFTLEDSALATMLEAVTRIPSVDIVRIGTRAPVTLPMRITPDLADMLAGHAPLYINTQFNHPRELTERAVEAVARLVDRGIVVSNQAVLLRGVNDEPETMLELCRGLLRARIRPYYLFLCDLWDGLEHLRTRIDEGLAIMAYLRGRISGMGIPQLVADLPGGLGKVPVSVNHIVARYPDRTVLRATNGQEVIYPEPEPATKP